MSEQPDLNAIWDQAKQAMLAAMPDLNRSLWAGAQAAQPLALDEDAFVLGLPPGQMAQGSHLISTANGPMVREAVSGVVGRDVTVELVEGTERGAWEREKERRELRVKLAEKQATATRARATAQGIWTELYEEIGRIFGATRDRRYATQRAGMMAKALLATYEAERKAMDQEPDAAELHEQQLNRALERVATLAETTGTMVAVEYLRVKSMRRD